MATESKSSHFLRIRSFERSNPLASLDPVMGDEMALRSAISDSLRLLRSKCSRRLAVDNGMDLSTRPVGYMHTTSRAPVDMDKCSAALLANCA